MRVLIAGGSGLIGRELADRLASSGYEVFVLSRSPQRVGALPKGVQAVGWDGKTSHGWGYLADGAGAIINLAGENIAGDGFFPQRWTEERKQSIRDSRLQAGQAIVEAIRSASQKPAVLIQSSAIGFYGPRGAEELDENSPAGQDYMAGVCLDWERSTQAVEAMGTRRVVIRTGVVLSKRGGAFPRLVLPFKFFIGGPMGNGQQVLSWIHIQDLVSAIQFLMENPNAQGVFNLTAPAPVTNAEFSRLVGKVMGRPSFVPVPAFAMRLMFGEVSTVVLDGQRVLPKRLQALGFEFRFPQAESAIRDLLGK